MFSSAGCHCTFQAFYMRGRSEPKIEIRIYKEKTNVLTELVKPNTGYCKNWSCNVEWGPLWASSHLIFLYRVLLQRSDWISWISTKLDGIISLAWVCYHPQPFHHVNVAKTDKISQNGEAFRGKKIEELRRSQFQLSSLKMHMILVLSVQKNPVRIAPTRTLTRNRIKSKKKNSSNR